MDKRGNLILSLILVSLFVIPAMLFAQRVIDLNKVWGDMRGLSPEYKSRCVESFIYCFPCL